MFLKPVFFYSCSAFMLRNTLIVFLALFYVVSTNRAVIPLVNYVVNHDDYTARCENKAKPELECDGCCQVKKEIAEAAQDENSSQNQTTPNSQLTESTETIQLFHLVADALVFASPVTKQTSFRRVFNPSLLSGVGTVPFQPPRV
jgi:hypothetical protein